MSSYPQAPSNPVLPAAATTRTDLMRQPRVLLALAAVALGLIATLLTGLSWGWLVLGMVVGLFIWQPIHGFLVLYSIFSIYPALRIISVSLRPTNALLSRSLDLIPAGASVENYVSLFTEERFLLWLWNSLTVTISVAIVGVVVAATSAYAFSRWRFPTRRPLLIFLLMTQMIPAGMMVIPIYVIVAQLGLRDQVLGLMLAYIVTAVPFSVWILKGYYDTIPPDLEEAAMVDGCNRIEAFIRIILPLSTPALSIVFLFNFLSSWSEFIVANAVMAQETSYTWPLGFNSLIGQFSTDWGKYAAGAALVTIPVLILFMSQARYLISGLTIGSVKS